MKKNNRKIISYFDDNLSEQERKKLSDELENSPESAEDFKNVKILFAEIEAVKNIETNREYFKNIVPRLREKLERNSKKFWRPSFSYAFASISVVIILFFIFFSDKQTNNVLNLNDSEQVSVVNELYNDFTLSEAIEMEVKSDSLINNLIIDELNLTSSRENIFTSERLMDTFDDLNEKEAEKIYSEIINKKFF